MKYLAALVLVFSSVLACALPVSEFEKKSAEEQGAWLANYIDKMTGDIGAKNPELAKSIRSWFAVKPVGKPLSEGMERLNVELGALELQARAGKVDLSTIQVEGVVVYVVKQKFQPAQQAKQ
jgi:hypothetical protein